MSTKIEDTNLYLCLLSACKKNDFKASRLDKDELVSMIKKVSVESAKLLGRSCIVFPEYTLHDDDHAIGVINLMSLLMGEHASSSLNAIEITLLLLSAYCHDIGMSVSNDEKENILKSQGYRDYLYKNDDLWNEAEKAKIIGDFKNYNKISDDLFQSYVRSVHHEYSSYLVLNNLNHLFVINSKSLSHLVADLCKSHGLSVEELRRYSDLPFGGVFHCDMQFLACVLRLADYLDLDPARAPRGLFSFINPQNERSVKEWKKHFTTSFCVSNTLIDFSAQFDDFFIEKALRDTLKGIDTERRQCMELLKSRTYLCRSNLSLTDPVKMDIKSIGYVYEEFHFQLEYKNILSLLMGTRLYRDEKVFIRELLQNALDACRCSSTANTNRDYGARISIRKYRDVNDKEILEVEDNGSGMTRDIIKDYFMRVGCSYYQSFAFKRKGVDISAVSQFGIGILSCFMVSDYIEVETYPDMIVHNDIENSQIMGLKLEIRGPHEYFVVRKTERKNPGTIVRVFLNKPLVGSLYSLVSQFLGRIPYSVKIQDINTNPILFKNESFEFLSDKFSSLFTKMPNSFGYKYRDLLFNGKFGFELTGCIRFYLLELDGRSYLKLNNINRYSFVGYSPKGETLLNPREVTEEIIESFRELFKKIYSRNAHLPGDIQSRVIHIVRDTESMIDTLKKKPDNSEMKTEWDSIKYQIAALKERVAYRSSVICNQLNALFDEIVNNIESFVSGQMKLSIPTGLLTQDGINLSSFYDLSNTIQMGIGYLYNLDLCGQYRLALNAARDGVIFDEKYELLIKHLYNESGQFLGKWFLEEHIPEAHIDEYINTVPEVLGNAVRSVMGK